MEESGIVGDLERVPNTIQEITIQDFVDLQKVLKRQYLFLEVSKDAISNHLQVDGISYYLLSNDRITSKEKDNILNEYSNYITKSESCDEVYKSPLDKLPHEHANEDVFLAGTRFRLFYGYPPCINLMYPHLLDYIRKNSKAYSSNPLLTYNYSLVNFSRNLDSLKIAALDGVVQRKYHPKLKNLYIYYIDESEAASIYVDYKRKVEIEKRRKEKRQKKKVETAQGVFHIFYHVVDIIDDEIRLFLNNYSIWAKYSLCTYKTKANLHEHLQLVKDLNLKIDPKIFKPIYPYVKGVLKTKNEYYKFIKLAINMKLIKLKDLPNG